MPGHQSTKHLESSLTRYAAFLRNVTLGRANSFTRDELERAFMDAGANHAQSFLASGNVIFDAASDARALLTYVRARLRSSFGFDQPWFVREMPVLQHLVDQNPFKDAPQDDIFEQCITFLPDILPITPLVWPTLPLRSSRNDVEVFAQTNTEAFSVTRQIGGKSGYATALLERNLGLEVTTRNWNTIRRMVEKFGS